eukprot:c4563_g1_i2.p1 GENE.c4563_g1_i2~~c4563_g1_i2.p1  ORF type:complete len:169 (+),score=23.20 c4563_g1_i2:144-650(+)
MSVISASNEISPEANNLMLLVGIFLLVLWVVHIGREWIKVSQFWEAHRQQLVIRVDGIAREVASIGHIQPHHFRELMRSRHKSPDAIQVLKFSVPFSLARNSLKSLWLDNNASSKHLGINFNFDCACPCSIQAYWGVSIEPSNQQQQGIAFDPLALSTKQTTLSCGVF